MIPHAQMHVHIVTRVFADQQAGFSTRCYYGYCSHLDSSGSMPSRTTPTMPYTFFPGDCKWMILLLP